MPNRNIRERDYKNLYNQYISWGPVVAEKGLGAHGTHYDVADLYEESLESLPTEEWGGNKYLSLKEDADVCNLILEFASVTNGELAYRSYKNIEEQVGVPLAHLA